MYSNNQLKENETIKKNEKAKEKNLLFKIVNENKKIRERVANTWNVLKKKIMNLSCIKKMYQ